MSYLIYSVEDDQAIAHIINLTLSKQGYQVKTFYDGNSFISGLKDAKPDLVLLDMRLPDFTGAELLKMMRSKSIYDDTDIIIVSANRLTIDKIDGFDLGADDYIEKPFDILELMSRVNAKLRRHKKQTSYVIRDYELDLAKHELKKAGNLIKLTNKEFEILEMLFSAQGNVISRDDLFIKIWGDSSVESRSVDMHIKSLRSKLQEDDLIVTVYGIGYKIKL